MAKVKKIVKREIRSYSMMNKKRWRFKSELKLRLVRRNDVKG